MMCGFLIPPSLEDMVRNGDMTLLSKKYPQFEQLVIEL